MSLLTDGIYAGTVVKTDLVVKHTIDGLTSNYDVYRIRIDELYYNNHNDRIATWLSKYRAEHNGQDPNSESREDYNKIIEGYIAESNPGAIRSTQNNIAAFGQRMPGVVLNDGLVIDGNRRLTCIRRIAKERNEAGWFEAVILPDEIASDPKRIKMLELTIQHGEEGKVDYNPIDRLVGVYNDIIRDELLTVEEYAKSTDMSIKDVDSLTEQAELMVQFLEFCNAPEQYHLARELAIAGPLLEMPRILKKSSTRGERQQTKEFIFANIVVQPAGDITRFVRKFGKIMDNSNVKDEFFGDEQTAFNRLIPAMGTEPLNTQKIKALRQNDMIVDGFQRAMEKAEEKGRKDRLKSAPLTKSQNAYDDLNKIKSAMIRQLTEEDVYDVQRKLKSVVNLANDLIRECEIRERSLRSTRG